MGVHKMGKRGTAEALYDLYGLPISLGAVVDSQQEMSEALAEPYVEIVAHAQAAPIKNADETSWVEGKGKKAKAWLWTLVTASAIVFMIQKTRATAAPSSSCSTARRAQRNRLRRPRHRSARSL